MKKGLPSQAALAWWGCGSYLSKMLLLIAALIIYGLGLSPWLYVAAGVVWAASQWINLRLLMARK